MRGLTKFKRSGMGEILMYSSETYYCTWVLVRHCCFVKFTVSSRILERKRGKEKETAGVWKEECLGRSKWRLHGHQPEESSRNGFQSIDRSSFRSSCPLFDILLCMPVG